MNYLLLIAVSLSAMEFHHLLHLSSFCSDEKEELNSPYIYLTVQIMLLFEVGEALKLNTPQKYTFFGGVLLAHMMMIIVVMLVIVDCLYGPFSDQK